MKLLKYLFLLIVIICCAAAGVALYVQNLYQTKLNDRSGSGEIVLVEIPAGSSTDRIADILKDKKLIDDVNVFKYYLRESGKGGQLQAGNYEFFDNQTIPEIVDELVEGSIAKGIKLRLLEGLRADEFATALGEAYATVKDTKVTKASLMALIDQPDTAGFSQVIADFLKKNKPAGKPLEGYLFPDTYEFAKDATPKEIVEKMLDNFMKRTEDLVVTNGLNYYQALTLASIVQREAFNTPGEPEEVAGIFMRRVQAGDRLGADATVLYILKDWKATITAKDLANPSPYNTRKIVGFPPTPISNAGLRAIKAAFTSKTSQYYYFIHDTTGKIHYAKTLAEQDANIQRYLR